MNYHSHADLGGHDGYGLVHHESESEALHDNWERRVLGLTLGMGATGLWNVDSSRSARETLDGYDKLSYFQVWAYQVARGSVTVGDPIDLSRRLDNQWVVQTDVARE